MDSECSARGSTKHHLFPSSETMGGSSSSSSSCGWDSIQQKRQRSTVSNEFEDQNSSDYKNNEPVGCGTDSETQVQDASSEHVMGTSTDHNVLESVSLEQAQNSSELDAGDSNADICGDNDDDDDDVDSNYDYEYDDDMIENDSSYNLAAKFDDLDLPPGVEATVPWLQKETPETSRSDKHIVLEGDIDVRYKAFKQFDTVDDCSDHYFAEKADMKKPPKDWVKKIQEDWKILENDLPGTQSLKVMMLDIGDIPDHDTWQMACPRACKKGPTEADQTAPMPALPTRLARLRPQHNWSPRPHSSFSSYRRNKTARLSRSFASSPAEVIFPGPSTDQQHRLQA